MNTSTSLVSPSLSHQKADRVGVAASVLCAIHCAAAPILLIALPSFGKIWAHPASHILVAIFVVPLAIFSIRKGYQTHGKRWILISASLGIFFVLGGAALPALTKGVEAPEAAAVENNALPQGEETGVAEAGCESECAEGGCEATAEEGECAAAAVEGDAEATVGCVDNCCPSIQVNEAGETSLHIPPAAIVTTIGGVFLIAAHIGNLSLAGRSCQSAQCCASS